MYEEFLKQIEDFMFIEDKPEKADVIFVPGNGYPQMVSQQGDLQEFLTRKNVIVGHTKRNGIF